MLTVIHWFRRDLRISDNFALHEAWKRAQTVVPVFIWDEAILKSPDIRGAHLTFLLRSLESVAKSLEALGHRLIVRHGDPAEQLVCVSRQTRASAVFTNRDYEPYGVTRDRKVATELYQAGVYFESFKDSVVWAEREILTKAGAPYTVFTPYSKAWRSRPPEPPVPPIGQAKTPLDPKVTSLPLLPESAAVDRPLRQSLFPAGEPAGQAALKHFVQNHVNAYATSRNFPALNEGTSQLSPHLRMGTINIRTVLVTLRQAIAETTSPSDNRGAEAWETELIWREFYTQILANFPRVATGAFRTEYDGLEWEGTEMQFQSWCEGQTGFPIVDAAMRCLNATGWMHNRLRMIVAMFLTKDLLISWQRGERYFMRQLVDGDLAANNGGWQWSASTGTDAAPYFRIFNPVSQGEKCDPEGDFVRRWIPELATVDKEFIHSPWKNPIILQKSGYPPPIVDHARQRQRCLALYQAVKNF